MESRQRLTLVEVHREQLLHTKFDIPASEISLKVSNIIKSK
jgi:hypothetical protein